MIFSDRSRHTELTMCWEWECEIDDIFVWLESDASFGKLSQKKEKLSDK